MSEFTPVEWASSNKVLHNTFVRYLPIEQKAQSLPVPPRFWVGEFPQALSRFYFHWQEIWPVGIYTASNVEVSGTGMPSLGRTVFLCKELSYHVNNYGTYLPTLEGAQAAGSRRIAGNVVVLLGPGYQIYGHWLVDILPRLYLLERAGFPFRSQRFLMPKDVPGFGLKWLAALGIKDDQFVYYDQVKDLLSLELGIFPTLARSNSRTSSVFEPAVNYFSTLVRPPGADGTDQKRSGGGRKLFVSRARSDRAARALQNRAEIEDVMATAGFEIVHPEHLGLDEQIDLFRDASSIVGEYGSAMHNCIFSPRGTRVLVLRGDRDEPGFLQSGIGEAFAQPTAYVFGRSDGSLGEFTIKPDDLSLALSRLALL